MPSGKNQDRVAAAKMAAKWDKASAKASLADAKAAKKQGFTDDAGIAKAKAAVTLAKAKKAPSIGYAKGKIDAATAEAKIKKAYEGSASFKRMKK